ncbi:MAG TPA: glycosyltransferase [Thermoanaerobaculia bacterium]|nr:glycosyltransferase [Thermoanaerobaculia bacterium]
MTAAPEPRRVLIATISVGSPSGTEVYTRDLALGLLRRGWLPIVYTTNPGRAGDALREAMIPVVTDLESITAAPDLIHGQHHVETLAALARFPGVPAIFVCHDAYTWHSIPPRSRRIRTIVAVDRNCRDRMIFEHGVAEDRIRLLMNPVDLGRFARRAPLPPKPRRALIFSNAAAEATFAGVVREACAERGIEVDVAGLRSGNVIAPEEVLGRYDLVFAKGRSALEAAATGCAVVVCDTRGLGGMISSARRESLRQLNFGSRTLLGALTRESVLREIDAYDANDAAQVSDALRASNDLELVLDQYAELYDDVLREPVQLDPAEDLRDIGASLGAVIPHLYRQRPWLRLPARMTTAILQSKPLAWPARLAMRIRKRIGV